MNRFGKLFAIALCAIVACKKKDGANTNLDPGKQQASNYMSTKPGSWWLFGARNGDVTRRTATGRDSTKNKLLFSYFELQDTITKYITPEYFGRNEGKYVSLYDMDGSKSNYVTLVFLMDSAKAGQSWQNTQDYKYGSTNTNLYVESSVDYIDGTLVSGAKTFTNITKVHNKLKVKTQLMPAYVDVGRLDIYFAKGIGIVREEVDINVLSLFQKQHTDSLLDYHIEE